ncbi:MAG: hypothetical protein ACK41C_08110 [Phenylobacterium sp.]|jgi:hypothetical protein|uniref:hypothetical protein n=1 Tax=Phenylobacterium sp. TaxID=1871053 RepID=UPI0039194456
MKVTVYSSFTFSYLNRARVLFQTLQRHHPDWERVALITDEPPPGFDFDPAREPFDRVVFAQDLGVPNFRSWLFKHDVVEICTAVKGPFLHQACAGGADVVIYLDPDTALIDRLDPLIEWLGDHDILLTPHLTDPNEDRAAILDNDLSASRTGIFNLGFVAVRTGGEGARFARWWNDRLLEFCYDDMPNGIFVDQRWCDHVPALFDRVKVIRDPGYNVASWNLSRRKISIGKDGAVRVNGDYPLRFWHFTKLGPTGDTMTRRYARDNYPVYEIWNWYKRQVAAVTDPAIPERYWAYGAYDDGTPIEKAHRVLYRERGDLQEAFPDPFGAGFRAWLANEGY